MLKTDNTPEEDNPAKVGKVLYLRLNDDGFVRFLWRGLKTGLITTLVPERVVTIASQRQAAKVGKPAEKEKK